MADKLGDFLRNLFTSSPYNGHVDRMSGNDGYKTRHMRSGAASHRRNGPDNSMMETEDPAQWAAYQKILRSRGLGGGGTQAPGDGWQGQTPSGVGTTGVGVSPFRGGANPGQHGGHLPGGRPQGQGAPKPGRSPSNPNSAIVSALLGKRR